MDRKSRGRIRTNDPGGMRGRILDAAAAAFQAHGYHDSSVQDIKRAAGVSSGAFHHHFASKQALGLAVIHERAAPALAAAWLDPLLAAPSAAAGVRQAMAEIGGELRDQGFVRGCPVNNLAVELAYSHPDFRAALQAIFAGWRQAIAARFAAEPAAPGLAGLSPDDLAAFVVAAYSGAMTMAKTEQSPAPLDATLAVLMRVLEPAR